ncbi:MAG: hypothetical protein ACLP3Q_08530 [Streptosporangiaceae bacterium]
MGWAHVTRDLGKAKDVDLAAMHDAAKLLMQHERRISPRVVTELCLIREETDAELRKRVRSPGDVAHQERLRRGAVCE